MIGLKEQTVKDAKSFADARTRHKWQIAPDYNVSIDCLDRHTALRDRVALYYEDEEGSSARYTWAQMIEASNRFATAFKGLGVKRGDVVALHLPQRPETAIAHMACYRIGAVALPISKLFGPEALKYRLTNSSAPAILVEPENLSKLDGLRKEIETLRHVIVVGGKGDGLSFDDLLAKGSPNLTVEKNGAEDPAP
jgi:acetyl-CoA synthetase